jgi:NAD(P)-dependent dehydrogenase (short-subunit alcohol dehydrogenase family)
MNTANNRIAVVTGASSGIGRATALLLVKRGFQVFGGVRKQADGHALQDDAGSKLVPVIMDVTDATSVTNAARDVSAQAGARGLDGLVNVAGIGISGPLEYVSPDDLREVFEVNVFGQIAVTQVFLPMIRKARGRIVNISSVGAHIAIPFGGVLGASKSAFGSLSDSLRLELRPFGIRVCVIEPASIHTPAVEKTLGDVEGLIRSLPPEGEQRYGNMLRNFNKRAYAREMNGSPPEVVAQAVLHALTARRPKIRYVVGKGSTPLSILPKLLPERLMDSLETELFGLHASAERR